MTLFQYVVARVANQLMLESDARELTNDERALLAALLPDVRRYERSDRPALVPGLRDAGVAERD